MLALGLPGFVALFAGSITADSADPFFLATPLARFGLARMGVVLLLTSLLFYGLSRWIPAWEAALEAERRHWVRHPTWLRWADILRLTTAGLAFLALAIVPTSLLSAWSIPLQGSLAVPPGWQEVELVLLVLLVILIASVPYAALRLFDWPR
jgi:hypothetical protein